MVKTIVRFFSPILLGMMVLFLAAATSTEPSEGIVDITNSTELVWAGVGSAAVVGFLMKVFDKVSFVRNHPLPSALLISIVGTFLFSTTVLTEWRTLIGQGIFVAMGATGFISTINRVNSSKPV